MSAQKPREWWATDESTDPADKSERWQYGRFSAHPYTHIPKEYQKKLIDHAAYAKAVEALKALIKSSDGAAHRLSTDERRIVDEARAVLAELGEADE